MSDFYISAEDLAVGYQEKPLIEHICFGVKRGEILTLIGPNGAGKSTILKSITRQLKILGGVVYLENHPMKEIGAAEAAKRMALVLTNPPSPELMTCRDVVATGRYPYTGRLGILGRDDWKKVEEAMELVQAQELADCDFTQISDGQRQRVLLARAICQEPEAIVLDEPTSFLDIHYKLELLELLKQMVRKKNLAVILSLHELDLAQKISDTVVCVADGKISKVGSPEEVFSDSYICQIYKLKKGSYHSIYGSLELDAVKGDAAVFVVCGNGTGIPVFRKLQRKGIPFAAGVIAENDLDAPVAEALAVRTILSKAFEPVSAEDIYAAKKVLGGCRKVICTLEKFGTMNRKNQELLDYAEENNILVVKGDAVYDV